jgi:hypothetical protein
LPEHYCFEMKTATPLVDPKVKDEIESSKPARALKKVVG